MSTSDIFLQEPLRPTLVGVPAKLNTRVFFALRTDRQRGSGSEEDPYNASTRLDVPRTGELIAKDASVPNLAVVTLSNHGFQDYDEVIITGVQAGSDSGYFNGRFIVHRLSDSQFAYRMHHPPEPTSLTAPVGPPVVTKVLGYPFDEIMETQIGEGALVCLGPGVIETRGFTSSSAPPVRGWRPRSKQRIVGSGIEISILKLVAAHSKDQPYAAIGNGFDGTSFLDGFAVSDLTIDCNMGGQPIEFRGTSPVVYDDYPQVACHAINLTGCDLRVQRVRVINSGTQTLDHECFPIIVGRASPDLELNQRFVVNCVVEDCIVEQPWRNNVRETSCIVLSSGERPTDGYPAYHNASSIRRCWVDTRYRDASGTPYFSGWVKVDSIEILPGRQSLRVRTSAPHGKRAPVPGVQPDLAIIVSTVWTNSGGIIANPLEANGVPLPFMVKALDSLFPETCFEIDLPNALDADVVWVAPGGTISTQPRLGVTFHHVGGAGGTAAVVEQNWLVGSGAGDYHDTGATPSHVTRRNHFIDVGVGLNENFLDTTFSLSAMKSGSCISYEGFIGGQHLARVRTTLAHGLVAGNTVTVQGAWVFDSFGGLGQSRDQYEYVNNYNVTGAQVVAKLSDYEFTYQMAGPPPIYGFAGSIKQNAGGSPILGLGKVADSISIEADQRTLTVTFAMGHGLSGNPIVAVFGAILGGTSNNPINGAFASTILSATQFSYQANAKIPSGSIITTMPKFAVQVTTPLIYKDGLAQFHTRVPHGLVPNQGVRIDFAYESNARSVRYEGNSYPIASASLTSFSYLPLGVPSANAGGLPTFGGNWRTDFLAFEENVVEVHEPISSPGLGFGDPTPFSVASFLNKKSFYFDEVYFRKNIIQHTVGIYEPAPSEFNGCKTVIVEDNVVGAGPLRPFSYRSLYTETMKTGGNYSWEGKPQLAGDFDVQTSKPDDLPISPDDIWLL